MALDEQRSWQTFKEHYIQSTNITNIKNTTNDHSNKKSFRKIVTWPGFYCIFKRFGGDLLRIAVLHEIVNLILKIVNKYASQPPPNSVDGKAV